jgi:putative Holliday junction resolvase
VSVKGRILGIDPGLRRVGIALSDPLGVTAQGLDTFDRKRGKLLDHIDSLVGANEVKLVVVGHPLSMSGRPNESSLLAEKLASEIAKRSGVEVVLWDERLTSVEAKRVTAGTRAPKGSLDRIAAVLILQGYLDSLS